MMPIPPALLHYIEGLKSHDVARVAAAVAGDVAFITPGRTLDKQQFLAFLTALYAAFPDWHYQHTEPEWLEDGRIAVRWRQGGTHTGTLALRDMPAVAPTGKTVRIPEQFFHYRIANDTLVEIRPEPVPGGAPRGIFEQLGVTHPSLGG
jgi:predicted ester cyclase